MIAGEKEKNLLQKVWKSRKGTLKKRNRVANLKEEAKTQKKSLHQKIHKMNLMKTISLLWLKVSLIKRLLKLLIKELTILFLVSRTNLAKKIMYLLQNPNKLSNIMERFATVAIWLQLQEFVTNVWNVHHLTFVLIAKTILSTSIIFWRWRNFKVNKKKILTFKHFTKLVKSYSTIWSIIVPLQMKKTNIILEEKDHGRKSTTFRTMSLLIAKWIKNYLNLGLYSDNNKTLKILLYNIQI